MPCYGPLDAWRPKNFLSNGDPNPDRRLVFRKDKSETGIRIKIPCGKCYGCKLEHSRQWAVRCMHEKRLHDRSAFLTLTYAKLPPGGSLVKRDLQLFMKKYRKYAGTGIRFFACGEYGETTNRPHYHVLLLNSDLNDKRLLKRGDEFSLYTSQKLSQMWEHGHHAIGDVTYESCAYVARYCMKKITGKIAKDHYQGRQPEFIVMSRRPGIGTGYFQKYSNELLTHDTIIVNGLPAALPRFYDNKLAGLTLPNEGLYIGMELIKMRRRRKITLQQRRDTTQARLRVREVVTMAKMALKRRTI